MDYNTLSKSALAELKKELEARYEAFRSRGLSLDMSRGKPAPDQFDLSAELLRNLAPEDCVDNGVDYRNYGMIEGIPAARRLMGELMDMPPEQVLVGNSSSLTLMYDTVARAYIHGVQKGCKPWSQCGAIRFICPSPGYDRHFTILEHFGIEMLVVPMQADGPDMAKVEEYAKDPQVKGIVVVPRYANPTGVTYSDAAVRRLAALRPAAGDFRIIWDDAYCVHHLDAKNPAPLANIYEACRQEGNEDMVYMYASTSKITYSGAGIAAMAASPANLALIKSQMGAQTIGPDKLNQLRHVKFLKDKAHILAHMEKHADLLRPKFEAVFATLDNELEGKGIAGWSRPSGGYFVSFDTLPGCARRVVSLCREAGVVLTQAGATFPYGKDPKDTNIRIAPTYPSVEELKTAMELFCLCVEIASVEKLIG